MGDTETPPDSGASAGETETPLEDSEAFVAVRRLRTGTFLGGLVLSLASIGLFLVIVNSRETPLAVGGFFATLFGAVISFCVFGATYLPRSRVIRKYIISAIGLLSISLILRQFTFLSGEIELVFFLVIVALALSAFFELLSETGVPDEAALAERFRRAFESQEFLSTLRSSLPTDQSPELMGLGSLPYLLERCNDRRSSSMRSARRFLSLTIGLAIVFSFVMVGMGYILLNEESAGLPRRVAALEAGTTTVQRQLQHLAPFALGDSSFQAFRSQQFEKLGPFINAKEKKIQSLANQVADGFSAVGTTGNLDELTGTLASVKKATSELGAEKADFERYIRELTDKINTFASDRPGAILAAIGTLERQQSLVDDVRKALDQGSDHVGEILKRLALALILGTFFVTILRYTARLYQEHRSEALKAESEESALRKFFIVFKSSTENPDIRKQTLQSLLASTPAPSDKTADSVQMADEKSQQEMIKELLSALVKKL